MQFSCGNICRPTCSVSRTRIPAAPVAMIDFSSAKSKKILDDAIAGRTGEQHTLESQCPRLKRGSDIFRSAALVSRAPYYRECIPKSVCKLAKPLTEHRTPETLQLTQQSCRKHARTSDRKS